MRALVSFHTFLMIPATQTTLQTGFPFHCLQNFKVFPEFTKVTKTNT